MSLELDARDLASQENYKLLSGLVVPRPIALVGSISADGRPNLAPFSYFQGLSTKETVPPYLCVSIGPLPGGRLKQTIRNLREVGEFVVNSVSLDMGDAQVRASYEYGEEEDKIEATGLTLVPSVRVRAPRVAEAPANLECRVDRIIPLGSPPVQLVIGEVVYWHVRDDVLLPGYKIDHRKLRALGRLAGNLYCRADEPFSLPENVEGGSR